MTVGREAAAVPLPQRHRPARRPARQAPTARVRGDVYYAEGLLIGYRWYDATGQEPLFPFGYGLS